MPKTILITGASSGFGKIVAFELAGKGHKVVATAQIWPQVTDLKRDAAAAGISIEADKLDVTNPRDLENAFKRWDVDVLWSNSGMLEAGPIAEQPLELIRNMFDVNFFGSIALVQGFVRKMVARKSGRIVFSSSIGGLWTVPYAAGYCATKHALEAFAEGLKVELAPFGIKVATINPGLFGTGFNDRGIDAMSHWYDPQKNFTRPESFGGVGEMLAHQLDPKSMVAEIVQVILGESQKYRAMQPKEMEDFIKQYQKDAWESKS